MYISNFITLNDIFLVSIKLGIIGEWQMIFDLRIVCIKAILD